LQIGVITYAQQGREQRLFCSWGFAEVLPGEVSVLAERIEEPDQIDLQQAEADRIDAESQLRSKDAELSHEAALEKWQRAVARLEAASGRPV
jgi:F0F1-type ATP synthase epsilon subunit